MKTLGRSCARVALLAMLPGAALSVALAQGMPMDMTGQAGAGPGAAGQQADARTPVRFPPELRRQTLATMRMHLQGLAEIQQAMAAGDLEAASRIASTTLGMASMHGDQAQREARYMPAGMRALGARLHRQAGAFALAAQDAAVTGDARPAQAMLGRMMQTCVACHATYRLAPTQFPRP